MLLEGLYWMWSAVWYWRDCIGYGLLYGTGGIVLDMVCCMVLGGLYWIWLEVCYWRNCIGYGLLYDIGGIVMDMV
jgi:hypothetical protein